MADDKRTLSYLLKKPKDDAPDWVRLGSGMAAAAASEPTPAGQSSQSQASQSFDPEPVEPYNQAGSGEDDTPNGPQSGQGEGLGWGVGLGIAGTATGVPGLGVVGAAIGTAIDNKKANDTLGQFSTPHKEVEYGKALADNLSFGAFGKSTTEQALDSIQTNPSVTGPAAVEAKVGLDVFGGPGDPKHGNPESDQHGNPGDPNPNDDPGHGGGYNSENGDDFDPSGRWAEGGFVTKDKLTGPDPEGPDDGYGALDDGEAVIPTKMVEKYGQDAMTAVIKGKPTRERLRKALGLRW
jgi:hypothetical protein